MAAGFAICGFVFCLFAASALAGATVGALTVRAFTFSRFGATRPASHGRSGTARQQENSHDREKFLKHGKPHLNEKKNK